MKREFYDFSVVHFVGRKRISVKKVLFPIVIAIVIVATLLASVAFFLFLPKTVKISQRKYYFVIASNHTSLDAAMLKSEEVRALGGSGYVFSEDLYRVAVFVYLDYVDAQSVATSLNEQGIGAYVYQRSLGSAKVKVNGKKESDKVKRALSACDGLISGLYGLIISLERSETTLTVAGKEVNRIFSEAATAFEGLKALKKRYKEGSVIADLSALGEKITSVMENTLTDLSELKYVLCQVVHLFTIFTN